MKPNCKLNDNEILVLIILGIIIFFVFILPIIDNTNIKAIDQIKENLTNNINTNTEIMQLDKNICSKQCCKHVQWAVPIDNITKEVPNKDLENYIGSNLSCNSGSGSGCLCMTKDNFNYLANRGSNAGKDICY